MGIWNLPPDAVVEVPVIHCKLDGSSWKLPLPSNLEVYIYFNGSFHYFLGSKFSSMEVNIFPLYLHGNAHQHPWK